MPEIRYYTVTQEREVKVQANSPAEAVILADKVFSGETTFATHEGRVLSLVRDRDIVAREDY